MRKPAFFFFLFFIYASVSAQLLTVEQYIDAYKDIAIREMKRMGVPAAVSLAQGILETENGNSDLVKKSNNHFGIKCKSTWNGGSVSHDDDASGECFRKYKTPEDSYRDHSNFLRGSDRYAFLFRLSPTNYKGWAYGLKKAGYATNPAYPEILIRNIEQYNLQQYTLQAVDDVPVFDGSKYSDDKNEPATIDISAADDTVAVSAIAPGSLTAHTSFNGVKAVYATRNASLLAIATDHRIPLARLLEFNDLDTDGLLKNEGWIFLEKKLMQGTRDFYVTQNRESVYDISQATTVQLSSLLKFNNFQAGDVLEPGTKVFLKPSVKLASKDEPESMHMHEVQPKEGLYSISKKYNVSMEEIRSWNNLTSDDLKIGQKLIIAK